MKKKFLSMMIALSIVLCLTGCGTTYEEAVGQGKDNFAGGYFTVISKWGPASNYYIVYANDTKVKYFVNSSGYRWGITPLYNADGTLQIYEEGE